MLIEVVRHKGPLTDTAKVLAHLLEVGRSSILAAAFQNSFFLDPEVVRKRTPYDAGYARISRKHYPGKNPREKATWNGCEVMLDRNNQAQYAWAKYSGRAISRRSGYGVRHIWGNPWDPGAYTAGWNLCYMPSWLGLFTEAQHPHELLEKAIRQASWDLFFRHDPGCTPPDFVKDPGLALSDHLSGTPLLVLCPVRRVAATAPTSAPKPGPAASGESAEEIVRRLRTQRTQSWSNLKKGVAALLHIPHEPFGTVNVANSSKSVVRTMAKATGFSYAELGTILDRIGSSKVGRPLSEE